MADQFVGEIRMFAGNFAPSGWAFCNGQTLPISQNTALFSLIGTYYGGNGTSTFALPNLQGALPMHQGNGAGLTPRQVGETGGSAAIALTAAQVPAHRHTLNAAASATTGTPTSTTLLAQVSDGGAAYRIPANVASMAPESVAGAGGGQPHNNLPPYLAVTFIIALQGIFPSRG